MELWKRFTRSGKAFSVYTCSGAFSLVAALQEADAAEIKDGDSDVDEGGSEENAVKRKASPVDEKQYSEGEISDCSVRGKETKSRAQKRKERRKCIKRAKRLVNKTTEFTQNTPRLASIKAKGQMKESTAATVDIDVASLPVDSSGYQALRKGSHQKRPKGLDLPQLQGEGYNILRWNGLGPLSIRDPKTGALIAIGVAIPQDKSYREDVLLVHNLLLGLGNSGKWKASDRFHHRGPGFVAVNMGMGVGTGNPPYNQSNSGHEDVVDTLLENQALRRLALHQSESFKQYIPKVYDHYHKTIIPFRERNKHLRVNWDRSVFASCACNLGPQVTTVFHRDCRNLPTGFCAIQALGNFDHTKGGHLVLKELKLIIEFPAGATIFIPSATITHGNTAIQEGETRTSFTQYTSGAIFRYVDNGFRTEAQFMEEDEEAFFEKMKEKATRYQEGLRLWTTLEDLM